MSSLTSGPARLAIFGTKRVSIIAVLGNYERCEMGKRFALVRWLVMSAGIMACGSDKDNQISKSSDDAGVSNECSWISDDACNVGCIAGRAARYNAERDCRTEIGVVTCNAPEGQATDAVCSIRSDGVIVIGSSSLIDGEHFTKCEKELQLKVVNLASLCR